jgi:hypothetical protein
MMQAVSIAAAARVLVLVLAGCDGSKKSEKGESEGKQTTIAGWWRELCGIAAALIGGALLFSGALLLVLAGLFGWHEVWSGTPQAVGGFTELAAVLFLRANGCSRECGQVVDPDEFLGKLWGRSSRGVWSAEDRARVPPNP